MGLIKKQEVTFLMDTRSSYNFIMVIVKSGLMSWKSIDGFSEIKRQKFIF